MQLVDLPREYYAAEFDEAWERERMATFTRVNYPTLPLA
jgi:hypothetical protein